MATCCTEDYQSRMREAFERVETPGDWRAPINAVVVADHAEIELIGEAVEFFTATRATITHLGQRTYQVRAVGYRNGPAGP